MPARVLLASLYALIIALACALPARAQQPAATDDPAIVIDLGDLGVDDSADPTDPSDTLDDCGYDTADDSTDPTDDSADVRSLRAIDNTDDSSDTVSSADPADPADDPSDDSSDSTDSTDDICDLTDSSAGFRDLKKTIRGSRRSVLAGHALDAGTLTMPATGKVSAQLRLAGRRKALLGSVDRKIGQSGTVHVTVKLSSLGRRTLRKAGAHPRAQLSVRVAAKGHSTRTTTHSVTF